MAKEHNLCTLRTVLAHLTVTLFSGTEVACLTLEMRIKVTVTPSVSSQVWLSMNPRIVKGWPELLISEAAPQFKPISPQSFICIHTKLKLHSCFNRMPTLVQVSLYREI